VKSAKWSGRIKVLELTWSNSCMESVVCLRATTSKRINDNLGLASTGIKWLANH